MLLAQDPIHIPGLDFSHTPHEVVTLHMRSYTEHEFTLSSHTP